MTNEDILDRAMDMEKAAHDCYEEIAEKHPRPHMQASMTQLAREEQRHMNILAQYRTTLGRPVPLNLPPSSAFDSIWQELIEALDEITEVIQPHTDEVTAIQRAVTLEKQSLNIYKEALQESTSDAGQRVFSFLVEQDERHLSYLENLLDRLLILYREPAETRPQL